MSVYPLSFPDLNLTNIAPIGTAEQSSLSVWSSALGANGVLRDQCPEDFGFHTDEEDQPWWIVDLHRPFPLEAIVLHNRRNGFTDKAKTITVSTSLDKTEWTTIHAGLSFFGPGNGAPPLALPLRGQVWARFVKLQLTERNYFHLSQVEIFVETARFRVAEIADQLGVSLPMTHQPGSVYPENYEILLPESRFAFARLIGLTVNQNGAFGNCVTQYANAIELARRAGLPYVQVAAGGLVQLDAPLGVDGITLLPSDHPRPANGAFLKGYFFHTEPAGNRTNESYHAVISQAVRKIFPAIVSDTKPPRELCIHIRSGDIFSTWVHADYVQPPLAFYKLVIETLRSENAISSVKLVFEDRRNPVIDPLEAFLVENSISYTCQSGSVVEDISAIANSRYMAFGYGTFGPAVCHFSEEIDTVFNFVPEGGQRFPRIPNIRRIIDVVDGSGDYIRVGAWQNSENQRALMVDHPTDKLNMLI